MVRIPVEEEEEEEELVGMNQRQIETSREPCLDH